MKYEHFNLEQRYTIACMLKENHSKKAISKAIDVNESTLYREIRRNRRPKGRYCAKYAQMLAGERCKEGHVKKRFTASMQNYVIEKLTLYQWSPEQIVGRAKKKGFRWFLMSVSISSSGRIKHKEGLCTNN